MKTCPRTTLNRPCRPPGSLTRIPEPHTLEYSAEAWGGGWECQSLKLLQQRQLQR